MRLFIAFILFLLCNGLHAQNQPVELDADRKPILVTGGNCLIKGATLFTVTKGKIEKGDILVKDGKIAAVGPNLTAPAGVKVIEAAGKFVTPGIIDAHSHMASDATNEGSDSITAEVRIHDVLNADSPGIYQATASGQTTALVLHGSANAVGGQSVVIKMKWKQGADALIIPDAPRIIKFALGENVTRANSRGGQNPTLRFPATRLGVEAVYRRAFNDAKAYIKQWDDYEKARQADADALPPRRDLRLETLADILRGKIRVHCHCYREDEILMMLKLAKEFGYKLTLQHALEAYKDAPEIAALGVGVSTFADRWGYKIEAYDAIPYNAALCLRAGIITSINSDTGSGMTQLNLEAAKAIKYGGVSEEDALKMITLYPAMQLGIEHRTGSLDVGKDADIALWEGHPLSVYSRCILTLVEGEVVFQRRDAFGVDGSSTLAKTLDPRRVEPSELEAIKPAPAFVLVGGTVHPVSGPTIPDGKVVIVDGKIAAVGKNIPNPPGARVVNVKGLHVYPGLIDAGSVIGMQEIASIAGTQDYSESGDFQPDLVALTAVHPASEHLGVTRFSGITTSLVRPTGGVVGGQASLVNLAGWTSEEMGVQAQAALRVTYPEARARRGFRPQTEEETQRLQDEAKARENKIADFFARAKRYADARAQNGSSTPLDVSMEAMVPYVTGKLPVIFQANSARSIKSVVELGEKFNLKTVVSGGREAWRVADTLAEKKIPVLYSPDNTVFTAYEPYDTVFAAPSLMQKAGVQFAFQSDNLEIARNLPFQAGMTCAFGLSRDSALKALTLNAAEILGAGDRLGSLDKGKIANVIVTDGDPMEITTSVHYVFINGKPVPQESKHTRLYQTYRQRTPVNSGASNGRRP